MAEVTFAGVTTGPASSSIPEIFDVTNSTYIFVGYQADIPATFEVGATIFKMETPPDKSSDEENVLQQLTASALGHLPIGDSSIYIRAGASVYQYFDSNDSMQTVIAPVYGAGVDYGIKPRLTIRIEWIRHVNMEFNSDKFEFDATRLGFYMYF